MGADGDSSSKSVDVSIIHLTSCGIQKIRMDIIIYSVLQLIRFPGFYSQEMLEFPGQYEAPVLMNAVSQRQTFNVGHLNSKL